jgi:hypothetical protein
MRPAEVRKRAAEERLKTRAVTRGPEAFSLHRIRVADALVHTESSGAYILEVRGGIGSFSIGTHARLIRDGKTVHATFEIPSWVWLSEQAAIDGARAWARAIVEAETQKST